MTKLALVGKIKHEKGSFGLEYDKETGECIKTSMQCYGNCRACLLDKQCAADQAIVDELDKEIERLKGDLAEDGKYIRQLQARVANMPTPEEARLFVGLVEYSAPTDDWNINALKTCAAFSKLKAIVGETK